MNQSNKNHAGFRTKYLARAGIAAVLWLAAIPVHSLELVIGEEMVKPGIVFVFEGAVKDTIVPTAQHLDVSHTDVHIEARVNWHEDDGKIPKGAPAGGFVPYLSVNATITSQATGKSVHATLLPHVNLIDNFHYARNIALPSAVGDKYEVVFHMQPPGEYDLAFHKDWVNAHGTPLFEPATFRYSGVVFEEIAKATR